MLAGAGLMLAQSEITAQCNANTNPPMCATPGDITSWDTRVALFNTSVGLFAAGGVALVGGVIGYVVSHLHARETATARLFCRSWCRPVTRCHFNGEGQF